MVRQDLTLCRALLHRARTPASRLVARHFWVFPASNRLTLWHDKSWRLMPIQLFKRHRFFSQSTRGTSLCDVLTQDVPRCLLCKTVCGAHKLWCSVVAFGVNAAQVSSRQMVKERRQLPSDVLLSTTVGHNHNNPKRESFGCPPLQPSVTHSTNRVVES